MAPTAPNLQDSFWKPNAQAKGDGEPLAVVHEFAAALDNVEGGGLAGDRKQSLLNWLRKNELEGDLTYASPEQIRGEPVDERSLVFSVGVLLFERLTGRHPFGAEGSGKRLSRMRRAELASGVNYFPKIPAELRAVVVKAIAAFPEERWNNLADLSKQLRGFLRLSKIPEARKAMNLRSLPAIPDTAVGRDMDPLEGDSQLHNLFELSTSEFRRQTAPLHGETLVPETSRRSSPRLSPLAWMGIGAGLAIAVVALFLVVRGSGDQTHAAASSTQSERETSSTEREASTTEPAAKARPAAKAKPEPAAPAKANEPAPSKAEPAAAEPTVTPLPDASFEVAASEAAVVAKARSCFPNLGKRKLYFGATLLFDDKTGASIKVFLGGTKGMTTGERACLARRLLGLTAGGAPDNDTMVVYNLMVAPNTAKVISAKPKS